MFKKNVVTPSMMVDKAVGKVENALNMFRTAIQEIDNANEILHQSKAQTQAKIESLQQELMDHEQIKNDAEAKINSHLELRDKLSQFVI